MDTYIVEVITKVVFVFDQVMLTGKDCIGFYQVPELGLI